MSRKVEHGQGSSNCGLTVRQHFEDLHANSPKVWHQLLKDLRLPLSHIVHLFQVLLGEVSAGLSTTQVVVKELKASASVQDQMQFLEEVQPYR